MAVDDRGLFVEQRFCGAFLYDPVSNWSSATAYACVNANEIIAIIIVSTSRRRISLFSCSFFRCRAAAAAFSLATVSGTVETKFIFRMGRGTMEDMRRLSFKSEDGIRDSEKAARQGSFYGAGLVEGRSFH